jgi:hypothetical protein
VAVLSKGKASSFVDPGLISPAVVISALVMRPLTVQRTVQQRLNFSEVSGILTVSQWPRNILM